MKNTKPIGTPSHSLGAIIGSFKSAAKKHIHKAGLIKDHIVWQRNFYEHIIRDDEDDQRIVQYTQFNPINWKEDQEFIANELQNR